MIIKRFVDYLNTITSNEVMKRDKELMPIPQRVPYIIDTLRGINNYKLRKYKNKGYFEIIDGDICIKVITPNDNLRFPSIDVKTNDNHILSCFKNKNSFDLLYNYVMSGDYKKNSNKGDLQSYIKTSKVVGDFLSKYGFANISMYTVIENDILYDYYKLPLSFKNGNGEKITFLFDFINNEINIDLSKEKTILKKKGLGLVLMKVFLRSLRGSTFTVKITNSPLARKVRYRYPDANIVLI